MTALSRLPIRTRLTAAFALLMALVLTATGAFVWLRLRGDLDEAIADRLEGQTQTILRALGERGLRPGFERVLIAPSEPFVQVYSRGGTLLETRGVRDGLPLLAADAVASLHEPQTFDLDVPTASDLVPARILATPSAAGPVVVVGTPLEGRAEALRSLLLLLAIGGPIALAAAAAIGWALAGAALRPVERMRSEAEAITASDRSKRLPVPPTRDEVARLGTTLNDLLGRLDEAIERERRFVDDASHELRTPLGILKTELDLALRKARTKAELLKALGSAAEETDRLGRLAEDLLVLARAHGGELPVQPTPVDLSQLVSDLERSFAPLAAERRIRLARRVAGNGLGPLDPDRIRQALTNLVDNALRYTPGGGEVTIMAERTTERVVLEVRDTGRGFPEEFLPRAFEPFARADEARSRSEGGLGLGLAIARAMAEAHGGFATAGNAEEGGAVVRIEIPI